MKKSLFESEFQSAGFPVPTRQPVRKAQGFCKEDRSPCDSQESRQDLVKGFSSLSTPSLNKIWLDPEEDEAWQDL